MKFCQILKKIVCFGCRRKIRVWSLILLIFYIIFQVLLKLSFGFLNTCDVYYQVWQIEMCWSRSIEAIDKQNLIIAQIPCTISWRNAGIKKHKIDQHLSIFSTFLTTISSRWNQAIRKQMNSNDLKKKRPFCHQDVHHSAKISAFTCNVKKSLLHSTAIWIKIHSIFIFWLLPNQELSKCFDVLSYS